MNSLFLFCESGLWSCPHAGGHHPRIALYPETSLQGWHPGWTAESPGAETGTRGGSHLGTCVNGGVWEVGCQVWLLVSGPGPGGLGQPSGFYYLSAGLPYYIISRFY